MLCVDSCFRGQRRHTDHLPRSEGQVALPGARDIVKTGDKTGELSREWTGHVVYTGYLYVSAISYLSLWAVRTTVVCQMRRNTTPVSRFPDVCTICTHLSFERVKPPTCFLNSSFVFSHTVKMSLQRTLGIVIVSRTGRIGWTSTCVADRKNSRRTQRRQISSVQHAQEHSS